MKDVTDEGIRVQYSGLIIFGTKLASVVTGMMFTLLITRNVTKHDFGIWANVFDLLAYFTILATAIPFWTTRFVARGKEGATKTGFIANLAIAAISAACYLPIVFIATSVLNVESTFVGIYLVASIQIINIHTICALEGSLRAKKPQAVGYGLIIEEVSKVCLAYLLIVELQQPLLGSMISLVAATTIQTLYYLRILRNEFEQKIQWSYVREWLRGSVANIYQAVGNQIAAIVFILLLSFGTPEARANYQAAITIASIIAYSSFLSFALYPKLLAENKMGDVTASLKMVLMFAIPMAAGALAIPESFLIILNEVYAVAAPILVLLAIDALVIIVSQFYTFVLLGTEKLDEEAKIPLRLLIRSNIFKVFTLPYVHAAVTLPTTIYVLTSFAAGQSLDAALYVTVINMATRLAMFFALYGIMRKSVRIAVPWRSIGKYAFAAIVMGAILILLPHPTRLTLTLLSVVVGALVYGALLLTIDRDTRTLVGDILDEVRDKMRSIT